MAKKSLSLRLLFWLREIKNYCYDKLMAKFLHIVTAKDYSNELVKIISNFLKMAKRIQNSLQNKLTSKELHGATAKMMQTISFNFLTHIEIIGQTYSGRLNFNLGEI